MTALTALTEGRRRVKDWAGPGGLFTFPVLDGNQIYKDSLVSIDANGYAIASTDTAGTYCVGVSTENMLGTTVLKYIRVACNRAFLFTCTGIDRTMMGEPAYVRDDNTVDNTSTNGIVAGIFVEYVDTTHAWVLVNPSFMPAFAAMTANAAELNCNAGVVGGTVTASKTVVVDANKDIASFRDVTMRNLVATGTGAFTGAMTGPRAVHLAQGTDTLTAAESGTLFICSVDAVLTLPDCTTCPGAWYTIMCGALSVGTGLSVSPAAADNIRYTGLTSVDNKDIINTGASDVVGDFITLVSDGVDGWVVIGIGGIWAKE